MCVSYGNAIARGPVSDTDAKETSGKRFTAAFDCGRLRELAENPAESITIRGRRQGDRFTPPGMKSGSKKIQDYFVDRKIPKENRDKFRLAAIGSEVLWIVDPIFGKLNEVSEKFKITDDTKETLLLEMCNEP
jgi:tRNA(Ile)-lysidine synthetase-like protein